ncbi:MAG: malto-oligosyltrehalose trehalohydrolase [Betaproteobacteria bacterium]|nr:malto-oligosyltrehalose trehalohydrolase [Betaproteobacteria bacterium]
MRYRYSMPFGAELAEDATAHFRLWAPAATEVEVEITQGQNRIGAALAAAEGGWFRGAVGNVHAGARYGFRIDGGLLVPDPASRFNPEDVHAPSMIVDPLAFSWGELAWNGRPWEQAVIYELHVGTFTEKGTFRAAIERLDHLASLGVTAIELMPLADFPGTRNWGYDGVLPFAPDASYGTPEDLKLLVQCAHARGLMVFVDVVYNHFGPEGNYLNAYAPAFFNPQRHTPWGAAIDFDGPHSRTVRDFFIHNALYWLEEYCMDGLRLDAVHAIVDETQPDFVTELCATVRSRTRPGRHVHIILENERNQARYLGRDAQRQPILATAQWNDDMHHAAHIVLTGESDGYYSDYARAPLWYFGRCLAEGFGYQGEASAFRDGAERGDPSVHLPAAAFVSFLQTHDQVGNRAFGERIGHLAPREKLQAAIACWLLAPAPPMLFMGEEFNASSPFLYFCDFGPELAAAVARGRREEFARFARFADPQARESIADPTDPETFRRSKLHWDDAREPNEYLDLYRRCLAARHQYLMPHLAQQPPSGAFTVDDERVLAVDWALSEGAALHLRANFSAEASARMQRPRGQALFESGPLGADAAGFVRLPAYGVICALETEP